MNKKKTIYSGAVGVKDYYTPPTASLSGWKYYVSLATILGSIGLALYPILIDPMLHVNKYKRIHDEIQAEVAKAGPQPGQLRKFESPWKRNN